MSATPLLTGIAATILAALQLAAWIAIGSFAFRPIDTGIERLPAALIVGNAATASLYAVFAYFGAVDASIASAGVIGIGAIAVRWNWLVRSLGDLRDSLGPGIRQRWLAIPIAFVGAMWWVNSITPPRDGDVMRYHLAHVRQIIRDGRWVTLPDYHYALPFGSTLNYLPFERLHIPQVAHLLNLAMWVLAIALMAAVLRSKRAPRASFLLLALVALQPLMLKSATTALADSFMVFVVLAIVLLFDSFASAGARDRMLLGFVATVGAQSRYQLLGVTLSVFFFSAVYVITGRVRARSLAPIIPGAIAGLLLASPFYVANYIAFRNPVWPLMIPAFGGLDHYAYRVAQNVSARVSGARTLANLARSFRLLLVDPLVFPIPHLALASIAAPAWSRDRIVRSCALFGLLVLTTWAVVQPSLYPRFSILLVPSLTLGLGLSFRALAARRSLMVGICALLGVGIAGSLGVDLYYCADSARYAVTGDEQRFHVSTWYYPVYTWVNDSTPTSSRFLVIVASGHSYYLNRDYRRADPFLSGYVDWEAVHGQSDLIAMLECSRFDYVIYDTRDWSDSIDGRGMDATLREAVSNGALTLVKSFDVPLVLSRLRDEKVVTTVWLLRRTDSGSRPDCAAVRRTQPFVD